MSDERDEPVRIYFVDGSFKSVSIAPKKTTVEELWEIVGDKLGLTVEVAQNFFVWGVEGDLEMLLYSDSTIADVRKEWPSYVKKYSNQEKIATKVKTSLIKRFSRSAKITDPDEQAGMRLVFKATCIVPIRVERNIKAVEAIDLFYMQAVHNVVSGNYPTDIDTALNLAGYQMQVTMGDRQPQLHKPGYLGDDILRYVPKYYQAQRRSDDWETLVFAKHELHRGKDKLICQMLYLQLVRQYTYYGSTFFRAKYTPQGQGFFEQEFSGDMVVGVNGEGVHLIDHINKKFCTIQFEKMLSMESDGKYFWFTERAKDGVPPTLHTVKSKQSDLINDLVHDWFAEWKRMKQQVDNERFRQNSQRLLSIALDDSSRPETFEDKIITEYYIAQGRTPPELRTQGSVYQMLHPKSSEVSMKGLGRSHSVVPGPASASTRKLATSDEVTAATPLSKSAPPVSGLSAPAQLERGEPRRDKKGGKGKDSGEDPASGEEDGLAKGEGPVMPRSASASKRASKGVESSVDTESITADYE